MERGAPWLGLPGSRNCASMEEPGACSRAYGDQGRRGNRERAVGTLVQPNPQPTLAPEAVLCLKEQTALVICPFL